jgi:type IV secretion system protein TrbG
MISRRPAAGRRLLLGLLVCGTALALPVHAETAPAAENIVAIPVPLPLPGQLKQIPQASSPHAAGRSRPSQRPPAPRDRVGAANDAARVEPDKTGFINAIQLFPYADGALYQVYARPGNVTDIALQEGEQLVGAGPVASGDTVRWMIGDTISGTGSTARVHILVKPVRADIATNLVINTDRRTYHLELRANPSVYMASVSWSYPQDELIALRQSNEAALRAAPVAAGMDLASLNFRYAIEGDKPDWRPLRAFDDGVRVFVEFPESVAQNELPPLFVIGPKSEAELVNYRVSGRYLIVDRLFAQAELRLGGRKGQGKVRIVASRKGK